MSEELDSLVPPLGHVGWPCTDAESGPDVGKTFRLPDGGTLYFGEMPNSTIEKHGLDPQTASWWIVHYRADGQADIVGAVAGTVFEDDVVERLALAMLPQTDTIEALTARIAQLEAERDAARADALEEAAKVAEERHEADGFGWTPYAIATAIRALKDTHHD